ncbi:MAG TPA: phospho-N-acetylmuramoyl-pentapeptide-transferase [Bacilli bacterium]|nr:phospho-N-acetylmuramoyl-pentapeptide-transferase [Bacilli bacterium]
MLTLTKVIVSIMIGFVTSVVFGWFLIPFLKKINFRQKISRYVGETHQKKSGTPTMGGLIFIVPTLLTVIILLITKKLEFTYDLVIVLFVFVAYAVLGFIDDFLSIKRGKNQGLTITQKFLGQALIAIVFFVLFMKFNGDTRLIVTSLGINWDLKWLYGVFILLLLVGFSNAVNLTDGQDGLAGGLSIWAFIAYALIALFAGYYDMGIFCFILVGSLAGFLLYNGHPARVFMGDTGSLALGATLATVAILTRREVTLFVVAFVFIVETVTVILQVFWFQKKGKRLFLMAPLHHHFEKLGYQENDIVKAFWVVGILFAMLGIFFAVWL